MVVVFMRCTVYFMLVFRHPVWYLETYTFYVACMVLDIALC
jgi:hypothetical protein